MIVKVQSAINRDACLIYNKDKTVFSQLEEFEALSTLEKLDLLPGQKGYYNTRRNEDGKLVISDKAEDQDW